MTDKTQSNERVLPPPISGEALGLEFDVMMARHGITIPEGRRETILAQYADLREHIALLHKARPVTLEPSNVFRVTPAIAPSERS
jgi:hypothetical protein